MSIEEITAAVAALSESERRRLYAVLDQQEAEKPVAPTSQEVGEHSSRSAHDRAKPLIASDGSGLGDLSTNPAYMEGFGEGTRL